MKRKVLISIVGIALFAVVIGFGFHENQQEENLKVKNIEALAGDEDHLKDAPESGDDGSIEWGQYCQQEYVNDPINGPSYCWQCKDSPDENDTCDTSTCKGCMTA